MTRGKNLKKKAPPVDQDKMIKFFAAITRALESLNQEERSRIVYSIFILYGGY